MCTYFHLQDSFGGSNNIYTKEQKRSLFALNIILIFSEGSHGGSHFTNEEQKQVVSWRISY